ncbi:MAG: hypothetical protein WC119_02815 [Synergistaceae bacterium]
MSSRENIERAMVSYMKRHGSHHTAFPIGTPDDAMGVGPSNEIYEVLVDGQFYSMAINHAKPVRPEGDFEIHTEGSSWASYLHDKPCYHPDKFDKLFNAMKMEGLLDPYPISIIKKM